MGRIIFFIGISLCWLPQLVAQETENAEQAPPMLYFILDASGSMWGELPGKTRKITAARQVLREFLNRDFQNEAMAFRLYGHRRKGDCRDSELVFPPGAPQAAKKTMLPLFDKINPKGKTPITYSLQQAAADLDGRPAEIVLITDGLETCDADPCELVRQWQRDNLSLKIHVVGFGLKDHENDALRCLTETTGGDYYAADSAEKLAESLVGIQKATQISRWTVSGQDQTGEPLPVEGILAQEGSADVAVNSKRWFRIAAGSYQLRAGVPTKNGTLYKPVARTVRIGDSGDERLDLRLERPPTLRATFMQGEEKVYGSLIKAYQAGKEVFSFRPIDQVLLEPGTYEFRSELNADNKLRIKRTISEGENAVLEFKLEQTVKVKLKLVAEGSGLLFRENYELWQNGEKRYKVHLYNGTRVVPGTYDVRLPSKVTPYIHKNLIIDETATQEHQLTVPCGHVTFTYSDALGERVKDKRVFIYNVATGGKKTRQSGEKIALVPGKYKVIGWPKKGYEPLFFDVKQGETETRVLREKAP